MISFEVLIWWTLRNLHDRILTDIIAGLLSFMMILRWLWSIWYEKKFNNLRGTLISGFSSISARTFAQFFKYLGTTVDYFIKFIFNISWRTILWRKDVIERFVIRAIFSELVDRTINLILVKIRYGLGRFFYSLLKSWSNVEIGVWSGSSQKRSGCFVMICPKDFRIFWAWLIEYEFFEFFIKILIFLFLLLFSKVKAFSLLGIELWSFHIILFLFMGDSIAFIFFFLIAIEHKIEEFDIAINNPILIFGHNHRILFIHVHQERFNHIKFDWSLDLELLTVILFLIFVLKIVASYYHGFSYRYEDTLVVEEYQISEIAVTQIEILYQIY